MNNAQRHFGANHNHLEDCYNDDEGSIHDEVSDEGPVELEPSSQSSSARKYGEPPLAPQRYQNLEPSLFMPRAQIQKQNASHSESSPHKFINSANSSFSNPNQNSSTLVKQFSDKIKMQAARLLSLEAYKQMCEQTLASLGYSLPLTEDTPVPLQTQNQAVELRRQLALKEQDLQYANQRAEKALSEVEYLKKLSDVSHGSNNNFDVNSLQQQIISLEEEKNALLDYIEEKDIGEKITKTVKSDKNLVSELQQQIEDMKIQHESQIADIQLMMQDQHRQMGLTSEDTFGKDQVLDLQKQLEQTRRAFDTAKSEKLDLQLQLDRINNEDRIQQLEQANKELQDTLFDTQSELEQLISQHETLQSEYNDMKHQLGQAAKIPGQIRQDYQYLQSQYSAVCDDLTKTQAQLQTKCDEVVEYDQKLKELTANNQQLLSQINQLEKQSHDFGVQIQREWETSVENLKGALNQTRGELTEKELIFQRVEKDLKKKLEEVEQSREQKSGLMRRVEDLNSEVLTLKQVKEQKDSKLQQQIQRNQELLAQLETLNYEMSKTKMDYERTNALQSTSAQELENTQQKAKKQSKVIDKLCSQMRLASELLDQLIKDCGLHDQIKIQKANNDLDYLRQVPEQLNLVAQHINLLSHQKKQLQSDLQSAELKIQNLEMKYGDIITEEALVRDKQVFLMTEVDTLKNQLSMVEGEKKQCYQREERIQRTNQQIKTQLDQCRKEQEKILSQMRAQQVKEEKMNQELSEMEERNQEIGYARQELELDKQRLSEQIEMIIQYMHKMKVAFKSEYLKEVFGDIVSQVESSLNLDNLIASTEQDLDSKEGELRNWAAAENTQLNDQVCQLRQSVETGRLKLKDLRQQKLKSSQDRERLLSDLRCTEEMERRTTQVALDNELYIVRLKEEVTKLQNQLDSAARSKEDLRQQTKAVQEEKSILERELGALREHIKYQAFNSRIAPPPTSNLRSPPMHFSQDNLQKPPLATSGTQNTQSTYNPLSNQSRAKQTTAFKLPTDVPSLSTQRSQSSKNLYMPQPIATHRSYQDSRDDEHDTNSNQNYPLVEHSRSSSVHQKISQLQNVFSQMRRNLNE